MRHYTVVLIPEREAGGFTVQVPALPGCFTEGETVDECLENARDVIALFIEELTARGETIPEEDAPLQLATVNV
jgi:antitoxin HicB